ncbi:RNA polymerase sigma factor [Pyxidicoccus sp. 3LG]
MLNPQDHFWSLWRRHSRYLFARSLRLMNGNRADAEDAFSVTMLRAYEAFPRYAHQLLDERAWLGRLLHNICLDGLRVQQRYLDESLEEEEGGGRRQEGEAAALPELLLLREEWAAHLRQHILALPATLRGPSAMRFLEGMSYEEIASELGLTNCNVRKRIQTSSRLLREGLGRLYVNS